MSAFSGQMRLAILLSVLWPVLAAAYFEPWNRDVVPFVCIGIGPVIGAWAASWVVAGFRKSGRQKS